MCGVPKMSDLSRIIPFKRSRIRKRSKKVGLPPGTLYYVGEDKLEVPKITIMHYDEKGYDENKNGTITDVESFNRESGVTWINVDGIHEVEIISAIGKRFQIHHLLRKIILILRKEV